MAENSAVDSAAEGLRQRKAPIRANTSAEARQAVLDLNALEENSEKEEKDRKTFGRTADGTGLSRPIPLGRASHGVAGADHG